MSVTVALEELRTQLDARSGVVYLLTVDRGGRPHCVAVQLRWEGDQLEIRTGTSSARNAEARPGVTLLSAPSPGPHADRSGPDMTGYSLIVDGDATSVSAAPGGGGTVRFRPTHAVFHRPAETPAGTPAHDCVPLFDHVPSAGDTA